MLQAGPHLYAVASTVACRFYLPTHWSPSADASPSPARSGARDYGTIKRVTRQRVRYRSLAARKPKELLVRRSPLDLER